MQSPLRFPLLAGSWHVVPQRSASSKWHQPRERQPVCTQSFGPIRGKAHRSSSTFSGSAEEDVKALISGVPGFVNYAAVRNGDGGMTVTVCEDKAGTDESTRRAAGFVEENLGASVSAPAITEGDTVLQFGS